MPSDPNNLDARLPLRFIASPAERRAEEAVITDGDATFPDAVALARFRPARGLAAHRIGCVCCIPRGPAAEALSRLFLARARGEVAFFRGVAVLAETEAGAAAIRAVLSGDVTVAARFRAV